MGGGGNFHANMAPSPGAGPNTGAAIHGNVGGPNTAFAPKSFNGTGNNGNWSQSWNWRDHDHFRHHRHGFFGFGLYAYGPDYYDYDYGCYRRRLVPTRFGLRWRVVWVCGPYY